tara:strand:+ start:198 stop:1280 length:1083 start_codon:yes stop_codon:yes gene_type:complete
MLDSSFDDVKDMSELPLEAFTPHIYRRGDVVEAEIVHIDDEGITIGLGLKSEGLIPQSNMRTLSTGELSAMIPGDKIFATVVRGGERVELSLDLARRAKLWIDLQVHMSNGDTIEAAVIGHNRGGLEVEVLGVKGFVPISHVAPTPGSDEKDLPSRLGTASQFNIIEIDSEREKLVLSERAIWQSRRDTARKDFIESLEEDSLVTGRVKTIRGFGAFVDLGDADGLVPISELSWQMLKSPSDVVAIGDELTLKVLKVDLESQKVSLSLKRTQPEPWESVPERYSEGDLIEGTVCKITDFGAFVRLENWVEGLIHISELSPRQLNNPSEIVYQGQKVKVKILGIDTDKRRMSLSYKQAYGL